jgi:cytochrome b6-f complex iron-sulfur subunit
MANDAASESRRVWLWRAIQGTIAATLAAVFYPVARFVWPREATESGAAEKIAPISFGELRADAEGHWPKAATFDFNGKPCLVIKTENDELKAFNALCTHVDCTVEYRADKKDIFCNCHNGVYDLNGHNVAGPPPRPLEVYKVTKRPKEGGKLGEEEIVVARNA